MSEPNTLLYRLAFAIHCGRHGKSSEPVGFVPRWVADLRLAEKYGAAAVGVDFSKYVWWRRALLLMDAEGHSWQFEPKPKK